TNALQDVPEGTVSFSFMGSQFTSPTGTTSGATITNIDPNVGMYLRPGMLVTGPGISAYTRVVSITKDGKTVTLDVTPAAGSGGYAFTGAAPSYVVSTLLNNWYSWADYYFNNADAKTLTSVGNTHGSGNRNDNNALILDGLDPDVVKQLKVGQVVTGPN